MDTPLGDGSSGPQPASTSDMLTRLSQQEYCYGGRAGFQPRRKEPLTTNLSPALKGSSATNPSARENSKSEQNALTAGLEPRPSASIGESSGQSGRVISINVSNGGVPKKPVPEVTIAASGLEGDRQVDLRYHGGPDRAVVLYSLELIEALGKEGHPIRIGSAGENLTVSGIDWTSIVPGVHVCAGAVKLLITKYCNPCYKISGAFLRGDSTRISQKMHPGWSRLCARVVEGGVVRLGDLIQLCGS